MSDTKKHGPDCDCGCQEETPKITLEFEDGENVVCEPLFIFYFEEQDFIALMPEDESKDDVFLFVYNEFDNGEFELLEIEDDDQFDRVVSEFERLSEEMDAALEEEE